MDIYIKIKNDYIAIKESQRGGDKSNKTSGSFDLTKFKSFEIRRNNSLIASKKKGKLKCTIDSDGNLYLKFSSLYVPQIDGDVIEKNISSFEHATVEPFDAQDKKYVDLMFIDKNVMYSITFIDNDGTILKIIDKYIKKDQKFDANFAWTADTNPRILDHHYGDLILFTPNLLKDLEKGKKYYIVSGQHWDVDYDGKYSLSVLDYQGVHKEEDSEGYMLLGTIVSEAYGKEQLHDEDKSFSMMSALSDNEYFSTGTGIDPVHLVTKFRKDFKLPKAIANLGAQVFDKVSE